MTNMDLPKVLTERIKKRKSDGFKTIHTSIVSKDYIKVYLLDEIGGIVNLITYTGFLKEPELQETFITREETNILAETLKKSKKKTPCQKQDVKPKTDN